MGPHYAITIDFDGRRCAGLWALNQGGIVKVGSAWGGKTVELKPGDQALGEARNALRAIVAEYHASQVKAREDAALALASLRKANHRRSS